MSSKKKCELAWPYNMLQAANKQIEEEEKRLPENEADSPSDLMASISYIFTDIAYNSQKQYQIKGASFILDFYRDNHSAVTIAEENQISKALVYLYISKALSSIGKCVKYNRLLRLGLDSYLIESRTKDYEKGYHQGYEDCKTVNAGTPSYYGEGNNKIAILDEYSYIWECYFSTEVIVALTKAGYKRVKDLLETDFHDIPFDMIEEIRTFIDTFKALRGKILTRQTPLSVCKLSTRSCNCLQRVGAYCIGDILEFDYRDLLHIRNMGNRSADEVWAFINDFLEYEKSESET